MANLIDVPVYTTGIYQLEQNTPALGGAPSVGASNNQGVMNWQAVQLAYRTAYLKQYTDMVHRTIQETGVTVVPSSPLQLHTAITNIATTVGLAILADVQPVSLSAPAPIVKWTSPTVLTVTLLQETSAYASNGTLVTVPAGVYTIDFSLYNKLGGTDASTFTEGQTYHLYMAKSNTSAYAGFYAEKTLTRITRTLGNPGNDPNTESYAVARRKYSFKIVEINGAPGILPFVATQASKEMTTLELLGSIGLDDTSLTYIGVTASQSFVEMDALHLIPSNARLINVYTTNTAGSNQTLEEMNVPTPRRVLVGLNGDCTLRVDSTAKFKIRTGAGGVYAHLKSYVVE
jgi:hypothetical protein